MTYIFTYVIRSYHRTREEQDVLTQSTEQIQVSQATLIPQVFSVIVRVNVLPHTPKTQVGLSYYLCTRTNHTHIEVHRPPGEYLIVVVEGALLVARLPQNGHSNNFGYPKSAPRTKWFKVE